MHMKPYILLTPGPLTTSQTVKEAMLTDWCTWDEDYNLHIVEEIRKSLVSLATSIPETILPSSCKAAARTVWKPSSVASSSLATNFSY